MTSSEAVRACGFWTTNVSETVAIGTTLDREIGEVLSGTPFENHKWSNPDVFDGWAIKFGKGDPVFDEIVAEIARRKKSVRKAA